MIAGEEHFDSILILVEDGGTKVELMWVSFYYKYKYIPKGLQTKDLIRKVEQILQVHYKYI